MNVKSGKILFILLCFVLRGKAQVTIVPVFGDKPITENTWFITKNKDSIQFDNIRFYLSNIQFKMEDKTVIKDTVKAHLVDVFESNSLQIVVQKIDIKHIKTLHFNIGIDSLTNVAGVLGGDLDPQKGMYWAWQSGYINMKIEGRSPQSKSRKNVFQYHIGGYLPPFYAMKLVELPISNVGFVMSDVGTSPKSEIRNPKYTEGVSDVGFVMSDVGTSPKSPIRNPKYTEGVSNVGFEMSDVGTSPKSPIRNPKYTEGVNLTIDFSKFFENITIATQNSIMMPCKEAVQLADWSVQMFSITK